MKRTSVVSIFSPYTPIPLGFRFLRGRAGVNPLMVNYHMVSDHHLPYVNNLYSYRNVDAFVRDLDFYQRNYHPIGMNQFLDSLNEGIKLPENSLLLTFDDGFREMSEIAAPLLLDREIPATFFITSDFLDNKNLNHDNKQSLIIDRLKNGISSSQRDEIEALLKTHLLPGNNLQECILMIPYRKKQLVDQIGSLLEIDFSTFLQEQRPYMTTAQVADLLKKGFTLGGHSRDHARFSELTLDEQVDQIASSIDFLVEKFSIVYRLFAFPYSDRGVDGDLFQAISNEVDASFGTHGRLEDPVKTHFQRISVEKFNQSAKKTIKYHYTRRSIYNLLHREYIKRSN